ncbi:MAG: polysaccharide biosynthesis protein, partial [bacterium]|nr:polysaccharide biosynthesis protein [bacterium]
MYLVVYYYMGLYSRLWRYATAADLLRIGAAVSLATGLLYGVMYVNPDMSFPRSVLVISWFINIATVGGSRFCFRIARDLHFSPNGHGKIRTLIIGAGDAGRMLADELAKHSELDY